MSPMCRGRLEPLAVLMAVAMLVLGPSRVGSAQEQGQSYDILLGSLPSIESGAESVLGISSLVFDQANSLIQAKAPKALLIPVRLSNLIVLQLYGGGLFFGTLLHEHFGHQLRAKEFDLALELDYNFPGLGGDFRFPVTQQVPAIERQVVLASGFESTSLLAHLAIKRLYDQEYTGSYVGLYLLAGKLIEGILSYDNDLGAFLKDPNRYMESNRRLSRNPTPNDPLAYALALTERYGYFDAFLEAEEPWVQREDDMSVYTENDFIFDQRDRMRRAFLLTAVDPAILYAAFGTFAYLINGDPFIKPAMLNVGGVAFMPSVRAAYGELGAENYFDLFLRLPRGLPMSVYYRSGGNQFDQIRGAGIEVRRLVLEGVAVEGQVDYWRNGLQGSSNFNVYVRTRIELPAAPSYLNLGLGYKSKGGLMGKPFGRGVYGYVGGGLKLNYPRPGES